MIPQSGWGVGLGENTAVRPSGACTTIHLVIVDDGFDSGEDDTTAAAARKTAPERWRPDAYLYTHTNAGGGLTHHATALSGPDSGSPPKIFHSAEWPAESQAYRKHLANQLRNATALRPDAITHARIEIRAIASTAGHKLISNDLARWLWRLLDHVRTEEREPVLLIQSTEPYLPWELLWVRDPEDRRPGRFLAETFALAHWVIPHAPPGELPLRNIGVIAPKDAPAIHAPEERKRVLALARDGRTVTLVPARTDAVVKAMRREVFDGWHLIGHGTLDAKDPEASAYLLELPGRLTPSILEHEVGSFGPKRPFVFANFCDSGRQEEGLTGLGGLCKAFLDLGAGAYLGTLWPVEGESAAAFSRLLYREFLAGWPLAEAVRRARVVLHDEKPGDPAWLAYTVFGPPMALCSDRPGARSRAIPPNPGEDRHSRHLAPGRARPPSIPTPEWRQGRSPPSALLRPEYAVVPFHGREAELASLISWVNEASKVAVRICRGAEGIGKTRLALELCERMRRAGWTAGLIDPPRGAPPSRLVGQLQRRQGDLLIVLDDATLDHPLLALLGEREDLWADRRLRVLVVTEQATAGDDQGLPPGLPVSGFSLGPLAPTVAEKRDSFLIAGSAFAERLGQAPPIEALPNLSSPPYDRVFFLHLRALVGRESDRSPSERNLLSLLLDRERTSWRHQVERFGLESSLATVVEPALIAVSEARGALDAVHAVRLLEKRITEPALSTETSRRTLAYLLNEMYGGVRWIDPLRPRALVDRLRDDKTPSRGA